MEGNRRNVASPGVELKGSVVVLRPVTADDIDDLERVFAEPTVARWWVDYDRARIEREMLEPDDPNDSVYVVDVHGEVAGMIQCYEEPDAEYRSASIDIGIAPEWHGKGVAVDALRTLARDLIERRGHHHITIDPAAENARAIACYTKVGFKPVGILRKNERGADGTFHDALLMDMLAGELT
jgi:aminoglycoside 6'-N-acetyltransferase